MLGFDIDRGAVRRRIYKGIEFLSGVTASVSAALAIMVTFLSDAGAGEPVWVASAVAIVALGNKFAMNLAASHIVEAIDSVLESIDSTPEEN